MNINNEAKMDLKYLDKLKEIINTIAIPYEFNLDEFNGIKIISDSLLHPVSVGNFKDKTILLPKNKTQKYLQDENYDLLKSTIYHELCHVDLLNKLPHLHELHKKYMNEENYIKCFTIMIYIEYIAHLKSSKLETPETKEKFYKSVNQRNWDFSDNCDKIMFVKSSPYIIGRDENNKYIMKLENFELKERVLEIQSEFENLSSKNYIDNYSILSNLEILVSKYITND